MQPSRLNMNGMDMNNIKHLGLFLLTFAFFAVASPAFAETPETSAIQLVKNFYAQLLDTMKQGDKLGFSGRFKKLEPIVKGTFDLPLMARFAVGPAWAQAGIEDQQRIVDAFSKFSVANYASRFTKFDGEQFDVLGEKPASNGGFIVETKLTPKGGASVTLNYLVRTDDKGQLRIVDVFLDASISELAVRRSEFSAIVKREGFSALIATLGEKSKKMGAT